MRPLFSAGAQAVQRKRRPQRKWCRVLLSRQISRSQLWALGEQLWEVTLERQAQDRRRRMVEEKDTEAFVEALADMSTGQLEEIARLVEKRRRQMGGN